MDWKVYDPTLIQRCRHAKASTFTPYRVNITKQPERITLEPTEMANVLAETQGITNRPLVGEVINKPSIVTKY
jgi:hypothetical protein